MAWGPRYKSTMAHRITRSGHVKRGEGGVARDDGNGLQLPLGDEHTILNGLPYQLQK